MANWATEKPKVVKICTEIFCENTTDMLISSLRNKNVVGIAITERPFVSLSSSYNSPKLCFILSNSSFLKFTDRIIAITNGAAKLITANSMKKAEFVISPTESNVT